MVKTTIKRTGCCEDVHENVIEEDISPTEAWLKTISHFLLYGPDFPTRGKFTMTIEMDIEPNTNAN